MESRGEDLIDFFNFWVRGGIIGIFSIWSIIYVGVWSIVSVLVYFVDDWVVYIF